MNTNLHNRTLSNFGKFGITVISKICILFILLPHSLLSQIYTSNGAKIYDNENSLTIIDTRNEKANLYIVKGTVVYGLRNQSVKVDYIEISTAQKTKPLLTENKIHDSKHTEKVASGRTETQTQPTLVYKPMPVETNCVPQPGKINSVAPPNTDFKQKYGIIRDIIFGISSTISNKNEKMFSQENQSFILSLSAYRVRPPPAFFDA